MDYWQAYFTPYKIVIRDLQILSLENEIKDGYRRAVEKQKALASGKKK